MDNSLATKRDHQRLKKNFKVLLVPLIIIILKKTKEKGAKIDKINIVNLGVRQYNYRIVKPHVFFEARQSNTK